MKMNVPKKNPPSDKETDNDRLDGLLSTDALTLDLVSALAGDRILTPDEARFIEIKKNSLGTAFHSKLLYAITHQHFESAIAESLWKQIVRHKYEMSSALKRNIRLVVAALDYLSNVTGDIFSTTLISEEHIAGIVDVSIRDGLTGLFNHAYFYRRADIELQRSAQSGSPVSIMMIDIDDFKDFNDRYGHQNGDAVLTRIGTIIKAETRHVDICCRYGGEEFGVVLPGADRIEAHSVAERLRNKIETSTFENKPITVSIGIAAVTGAAAFSAEVSIRQADDALYEAKTTGKKPRCSAGIAGAKMNAKSACHQSASGIHPETAGTTRAPGCHGI